ncbi:hypothetical protein [Geodermatophilus sp. URMC 63]
MDAQAGAAAPSESLSSELLGFSTDTRVLIVNCDDLGMHESVNAAVFEAVREAPAPSLWEAEASSPSWVARPQLTSIDQLPFAVTTMIAGPAGIGTAPV